MLIAPLDLVGSLELLVTGILGDLGILKPPIDAIAVAEGLGIEVRQHRLQQERGRLIQSPAGATCVVRQEPRPERTQWTVAHEIGEYLLPDWAERAASDFCPLDPSMREWLANRFASCLLIPRQWFLDDAIEHSFDLLALKQIYQTASHELLAMRMLDSDRPTIITIFDNNRLTRRIGNLNRRPPSLASIEQQARQCAHSTGTFVTGEDGQWDVQVWPIHEPSWQREIMRSLCRWPE